SRSHPRSGSRRSSAEAQWSLLPKSSQSVADARDVLSCTQKLEGVQIRDITLRSDDVPGDAVRGPEVGVPRRDDAADERPVVLVVEELPHLAWDGPALVAATVGGGH